jgi:DNA-binding transcriptional LysR family regulator
LNAIRAGLQLTPAGEHLLHLARDVIASVYHMRAEMGNYALGRQSVLRLDGNTSAMTQFLPGDIAAFQSGHQDVRVVLEETWSDDAVRRVRSGEVDLGVIVEGCDVHGLFCRPYRHDRLAAVVRRMLLVVRNQPTQQTPLGALLAHLEACAAGENEAAEAA